MHKNHSSNIRQPTLVALAIASALHSPLLLAQEQEEKKVAIETIEVTAQKRVENIQEVPIAISAFSADALRKIGASDIDDLGNITPGLETNNVQQTQPRYDIRGIRTNDFGIGTDPAVGVYIDDVYMGRSGSALMAFNDVERVEVLKGPQGTLFGRNTAAGAIRILTNKPVNDYEGNYRLTLGNFGKKKFEGLYNFPISETLSFRGSMVLNERDGYIDARRYVDPQSGVVSDEFKNVKLGDENGQAFRASLLWTPSDKTEVLLRAEFDELDQDSRPNYALNPQFSRDRTGPLDPFNDTYETDIEAKETRHAFNSSLHITHDLGWAEFKSITAFSRFNTANQTEDDGGANRRAFFASINKEKQEQISQEFRLTGSTDGGIQWTTGLTYSNEDIEQETIAQFMMESLDSFALNQSLAAAGLPPTGNAAAGIPGIAQIPLGTGLQGLLLNFISPTDLATFIALTGYSKERLAQVVTQHNLGKAWNETTENFGDYTYYGAYADVKFPVTDKLDITVGARYTRDEKDFGILSYYRNQIDVPVPGAPAIPLGVAFGTQYFLRDSQGNAIKDAAGNFQPTPQSNTWNKLTPRVVAQYQWNDDVMTYFSAASGFKSGGFNSLGQAPAFDQEDVNNIEIGLKSTLFDDRVKFNLSAFSYDYDNLQIVKLTGSNGSVPVYNVRNVDAEGKGLEIESEWAVNENLTMNFNYAYLDTEYTKYNLFAGETTTDDLTGQPLSGVPKNRFHLGLDYFLPADEGEWFIHLDATRVGDRTNSGEAIALHLSPIKPDSIKGLTADNKIKAYTVVNARFAYQSDNDWELALFARNLLDEEYLLSNVQGQGATTGSPNLSRGLPRMWGVEFTQRF